VRDLFFVGDGDDGAGIVGFIGDGAGAVAGAGVVAGEVGDKAGVVTGGGDAGAGDESVEVGAGSEGDDKVGIGVLDVGIAATGADGGDDTSSEGDGATLREGGCAEGETKDEDESAGGGWRTENGERRTENGERRTENGERRVYMSCS